MAKLPTDVVEVLDTVYDFPMRNCCCTDSSKAHISFNLDLPKTARLDDDFLNSAMLINA